MKNLPTILMKIGGLGWSMSAVDNVIDWISGLWWWSTPPSGRRVRVVKEKCLASPEISIKKSREQIIIFSCVLQVRHAAVIFLWFYWSTCHHHRPVWRQSRDIFGSRRNKFGHFRLILAEFGKFYTSWTALQLCFWVRDDRTISKAAKWRNASKQCAPSLDFSGS